MANFVRRQRDLCDWGAANHRERRVATEGGGPPQTVSDMWGPVAVRILGIICLCEPIESMILQM